VPPLLLGTAFLILLILLSAALGRRLLRWLHCEFTNPITHALFATGLGLGALQYLSFTLLAFGIASPMAFRIAVGLLALLLAPDILRVIRSTVRYARTHRRLQTWEKLLYPLFGIFLILVFLRAVCPITDDDGLSYHLTAAVRLLHAGHFTFLPTFTYTNWPLGVESLFMLLLGLNPTAPVGIIQFTFAALVLATVWHAGRRLGGPVVGAGAAVLMLTYKVFWEESTQAHVDLGTALFAMLGVFALMQYLETPRKASLFKLAALFAGLAATTKLNGLWVIIALSSVLLFTRREVDTSAPADRLIRKQRLKEVIQFILIACCPVLPWLIRTWIVTGNPVYPIFFNLLGGKDWTAEGWPRIQYYFLLMNTPPGMAPTRPNLLLARAVLVLATLGITLLVYRGTRHSRLAVPARFAATFATLVFLGSGYNLRFLLAAYPPVMLCAACALTNRGRWAPIAVCAVGILLIFRVGYRGLDPKLPQAVEVAFGKVSTEDYLRDTLPDYKTVDYVNTHLPESARLLVGTWEESTAYYRPFALRANYWLQDSVHYDSPEHLESDLKRLGVTHLVLKPMEVEWCAKSSVCNGRMTTETAALTDLAARHGTKLYTANGVTLYALSLPR
jgi:hypothetical protein